MKAILEALAYMPRYLTDLGSVLAGPKRFIAGRNARAEETFRQSLMFLLYSVVVVCLLQAPLLPAGTHIGLFVAGKAALALVTVCLFAVSLRVAWAVVGGRSTLRSFFVTYAYFAGAFSVVWVLFVLVAEGVVKVFEPEFYAVANDANLTPKDRIGKLTELRVGPGLDAAFAILVAGVVVAGTWGLIAWGAYRELNGLGKWRSVGAFMVLVLLAWVVNSVVYFINAALGAEVMLWSPLEHFIGRGRVGSVGV